MLFQWQKIMKATEWSLPTTNSTYLSNSNSTLTSQELLIKINLSLFHAAIYLCVYMLSHSVVSDSLQSHGPQFTRLLCSWDSPGKNTGVGCHFLLQRIFLTQGSNPHLLSFLHWQTGFFFFFLPLAPPGERQIFNVPPQGYLNSSLPAISGCGMIQKKSYSLKEHLPSTILAFWWAQTRVLPNRVSARC